jgi:hypothetical protein
VNKPTYDELVEALELMALQYLTEPDGSLFHDFMSAGEAALPALERLGILETLPESSVIWRWVEGHRFRDFADRRAKEFAEQTGATSAST